MKIPSSYAKATRTLFNRLRREYGKDKHVDLTDPVEQLLLSLLATDAGTRQAKNTLKMLAEEMTDFNELRVTPVPELAELLAPLAAEPAETARAIVDALNWVFSTFDSMDLTGLREHAHPEIRAKFESIPACPDHARCAVLLLSFGIPVFPVDRQMRDYLVHHEALPEGVSPVEAEHFMERHLKSAEVREFYLNVKRASERKTPARTTKTKKSRSKSRK